MASSYSAQLIHPWIRDELLLHLEELADPAQTANWLNPDPSGLAVGIDETIHFFFDDHEFDQSDIGVSLRDDAEVAAILKVKNAIDAILETNRKGNSACFLRHAGWPEVESTAAAASALLRQQGRLG